MVKALNASDERLVTGSKDITAKNCTILIVQNILLLTFQNESLINGQYKVLFKRMQISLIGHVTGCAADISDRTCYLVACCKYL